MERAELALRTVAGFGDRLGQLELAVNRVDEQVGRLASLMAAHVDRELATLQGASLAPSAAKVRRRWSYAAAGVAIAVVAVLLERLGIHLALP